MLILSNVFDSSLFIRPSSLECDSHLRADFLAAETGYADILINLGYIVLQGKGRSRALFHAGTAAGAEIGIGLGPKVDPAQDKLFESGHNCLVFLKSRWKFKIGDDF